jgi:hypothetical protein
MHSVIPCFAVLPAVGKYLQKQLYMFSPAYKMQGGISLGFYN